MRHLLPLISNEQVHKILALVVAKERPALQQALGKVLAQEAVPQKVAWQQVSALVLCEMLRRAVFDHQSIDELVLTLWLRHSPALAKTVWQALQAHGYAAPGPVPKAPVQDPQHVRLADIRNKPLVAQAAPGAAADLAHFFCPGGQSVLTPNQDEAVTVMAHLLGWTVTGQLAPAAAPEPVSPAAPAPAPARPDPAHPLPGDDEPALLALEARFKALSKAEIRAIPPRESALLVARSRQRAAASSRAVVLAYLAGTYDRPPSSEAQADDVLAVVQGYADALAEQLRAVADGLQRGELPADLAPEIDELDYVQGVFEAIWVRLGGHLAGPQLPPAAGRSVAGLQALAAAVRAGQGSGPARATALARLAQLADVRHRTLADFAPLLALQAEALALATALEAAPAETALPPAAAALAAGTHPWATLLHLAAHPEALNDLDEQSAAFAALEEALPRALLTALLLRKLTGPAAAETGAVEPAAGAAGAVAAAPALARPVLAVVPAATVVAAGFAAAYADDEPDAAPAQPPAGRAAPDDAAGGAQMSAEGPGELLAEVEATTGTAAPDLAWLPAAQWQLLAEARPALAWHLTRAAAPAPAPALPARLLHALALAPHLQQPTAPLARALFVDFQAPAPPADDLAGQVLAVAAALRPALLAPATGAATWLAPAPPLAAALPALAALLRLVAGHAPASPAPPPLALRPLAQPAWQQGLDELRLRLKTWETTASTAHYLGIAQHPATLTWQGLLAADQPAGQLLALLRASGPPAPLLLAVQTAVDALQADALVASAAPNAAAEPAAARLLRWPAEPAARAWLRARLHELLDQARQWLQWRALQPGRGTPAAAEAAHKKFAHQLATALAPAQREMAARQAAAPVPAAADELQKVTLSEEKLLEENPRLAEEAGPDAAEPDTETALQTALALVARELTHLHTLLHHPARCGPEPATTALLHAPLLPHAALPLDGRGQLPPPAAAWLPALREAAAAPTPTWTEAFAGHLGRGQHQGTGQILARPGAGIGASGAALALLHEARAQALADDQTALLREAETLRGAADLALRRGHLPAAARADALLQLAALDHRLWLARQGDAGHFDGAAQRWLFAAVADTLRQAEAAHPYPAPGFGPANPAFAHFFPDHLRLLEHELETHPLPELLARLRQGSPLAGTALHLAPPETRAAAAAALGAWEELRGERTGQGPGRAAEVEAVLAFVGFEAPRLAPAAALGQGTEVADLDTQPLPPAGEGACPVAAFGSAAQGQYRLALVWHKVAEAGQLLDVAGRAAQAAPVAPARPLLLLYFNSLTEAQRHDLAAECRARRQTVLVLDRPLLLYLATAGLLPEAPPRRALFFQLALPFTWLEPFPSAAPELFAGHEHLLQALFDPAGPTVLTAAPGTGKTVLLQALVRRHHAPAEGRLVLLLNSPPAPAPESPLPLIEQELRRELLAHGVVPPGMGSGLTPAKALRYAQTWVLARPERRLLLLLDNADALLTPALAHFSPFGQAAAGVARATAGRFRLVAACSPHPLSPHHRSSDPNPARVHLGPLLAPADAGAAEALLRRPLESLGLVFDDEVAVSEVLAAASYYPHAVQLAGQHLLAAVYARPRPAPGERPAHRLTLAEVRAVLKANQVEFSAVGNAVMRQSVEALLCYFLLSAGDAQEQYTAGPGAGWLPAELYRAVRGYWPDGATGPNVCAPADYARLLNELHTAGVVLQASNGRYFINPPYKSQMESDEEMRSSLSSFSERPSPIDDDDAPPPGRPPAAAPAAPKVSLLKRLTSGPRRP